MKGLLEKTIASKDVKSLVEAGFGILLTPTQEALVRCISFREHKRVIVSAHTRYGKSYAIAIAVLLYILFNRDKTINLIAPTNEQATILRNYMASMMVDCDLFEELIPVNLGKLDRLNTELSKKRFTFNNGVEIRVFSAEGEAKRLMGWGADLVVLDESCLITEEVYRSKISRMLGDSPDSMLVEIGNPWDRLNQMWKHWNSPDFVKFHIPYTVGLKEGRITEAFVDEQRRTLTPLEFGILYRAEFPEDSEDTLIRMEWIRKALEKPSFTPEKTVYGLDVAEQGLDSTVLVKYGVKGNCYQVEDVKWWNKVDTMPTVGKVREYINDDKESRIFVDATGVGKGVYDRLKELKFHAVDVKVGRTAPREPERMLNTKSMMYWGYRNAFEEGRMRLLDVGRLVLESNSMRYELTSGGKIKIVDPDKSPDFSDAAALPFSGGVETYITALDMGLFG